MVTEDMIKNSLEAKWRKQHAKLWILLITIIFVITIIFCLIYFIEFNKLKSFFIILGISFGIYIIHFLSFILFYYYKYKKLFQNLDQLELYKVLLDEPSTSWYYRGAVYYTISFKRKNGDRITLPTKPIWSSGLMNVASLEEYNNKTIQIAYNHKKNEIIVLDF